MLIKVTDDYMIEAMSLDVSDGIKEDGSKYIALEVTPTATNINRNRDGPYADDVFTFCYDEERFCYVEALVDAKMRIEAGAREGCVDMRDLATYGLSTYKSLWEYPSGVML